MSRGRILVAAVAATVLLAAGAVIAWFVLRPAPPGGGPTGGPNTPASPSQVQARVRIKADAPTATTLRLLGPGADAPTGLGPLAVMDRPVEPMYLRPGSHRGILARELFRQAVLLAARDELGLTTRDAVLREAVDAAPPYAEQARVELTSLLTPGKAAHLAIDRIDGDRREPLWSEDFPLPDSENLDYVRLLEHLEPLTRTAFPEALRKAGFPSRPRPPAGDAESPADAAGRLTDWSYVAQFAAARALHAAARSRGESLALLTDLARAYSHLGVLTEHQWNAVHKAYKARALLYAQRLLGRAPGAAGLRARAYAETLVGLPEAARADLDKAAADPAPAPPWAALLTAACQFDGDALAEAARADPGERLAPLLLFLTEETAGAPARAQDAAARLLAATPDCLRALDTLSASADLGVKQQVLRAAAGRLDGLGARIRGLPDAPAGVRAAGGDLDATLRALAEAGGVGRDDGEPAWGALANLVREDRFLNVFRQAEFIQINLQSSAADYLAGAKPAVADHPYHAFFDLYTLHQKDALDDAGVALRKAIDPAEVETTQGQRLALMLHDDEVDGPNNHGPDQALRHQDDVYRDLLGTMRNTHDADRLAAAHRLLAVGPLAPAPAATLIDEDWPFAEKHVAEWEKTHARHPAVLAALARRYDAMKRPDDEERCLKAYLLLSPDEETYVRLARLYQSQGKTEQWRSTLEEFLKQPETGLGHARVRADLARDYMNRKEYDKARPYAEAAAASGSEWGMRCAQECLEQMGEWDESEGWAKRIAQAYPASPTAAPEWVNWCLRTGRGDLKGALLLRMQPSPPAGPFATPVTPDPQAEPYYHLLNRDAAKALPAFQSLQQRSGERFRYALLIAALAQEAGRADLRDAALQSYPPEGPLATLAGVLRDHFRARGAALDLKAVEDAMTRAYPTARLDGWFVVGRLLILEGRKADALECFRRVAEAPESDGFTRAGARDAVRQWAGEKGRQ